MTKTFKTVSLALLLASPALAQSQAAQSLMAQSQVAPETHPVGDIPDTQAFVRYTNSAGGYSLEVPEGWARSVQGADVTFTSTLGAVEVNAKQAAGTPSVGSVKANELAALTKSNPNLKVTALTGVTLPTGKAVRASFTSSSAVNAVTGKSVPLENDVYVFAKNGREAVVHFSAPLGSDNVDAWQRMASSFKWM